MPPSLLGRVSQEDDITSPEVKSQPPGGVVADVLILLIAVTLLAFFIMVLGIFVDSWLFVFTTGILKYGVDLNSSYNVCSASLFLCLTFYVITKILFYIFLVERAYVVRNDAKPRLKSKLYIFNTFVVICLYSFKDIPQTPSNIRLRSMVMRTFVGAILTTLSSSTNIAVIVGFNGEPGWLCLLCCNCDILFCSIVVQWVTSHDNSATTNSTELKIAVLTAARESYRDRPLSGGTLRASASGDNASSRRDADSERRGGGGGLHRYVTSTTEYTPLGEMDVTTYPFRRADNNAAYWSTEILNCDPQQQQPEHALAETMPLQYKGEATTTTTTRPSTATTDPDRVPPGIVVGAGVVETVIVGGKDTTAAEPFGKGPASNS
ncbi:hypothetical protein KJ359_000881 [Pestalotiopsis sp. 9143b]|nr:hypothetical protein KJ359_000881 [Pestalotiopsis sp. 9143b]